MSGSVVCPADREVSVALASDVALIDRSECIPVLSATGEISDEVCEVKGLAAEESSKRSRNVNDDGEDDRVESMALLVLYT